MDLVKFCERDPSQYADVLLYLAAQNYCKNLPADMRGQLFYALLNWKDCHKEIQNQCARLATSYEVCWYEKEKMVSKRAIGERSIFPILLTALSTMQGSSMLISIPTRM